MPTKDHATRRSAEDVRPVSTDPLTSHIHELERLAENINALLRSVSSTTHRKSSPYPDEYRMTDAQKRLFLLLREAYTKALVAAKKALPQGVTDANRGLVISVDRPSRQSFEMLKALPVFQGDISAEDLLEWSEKNRLLKPHDRNAQKYERILTATLTLYAPDDERAASIHNDETLDSRSLASNRAPDKRRWTVDVPTAGRQHSAIEIRQVQQAEVGPKPAEVKASKRERVRTHFFPAAQKYHAPFPAKYHTIWQQHHKQIQAGNISAKAQAEYRAALTLLEDYAGMDGHFGPHLTLFFKGHWFRHETKMIRHLLKAHSQKVHAEDCTLEKLLHEIKSNLQQRGVVLNPKGSLAKRLHFIQQQSKLPFDITELVHQKTVSLP